MSPPPATNSTTKSSASSSSSSAVVDSSSTPSLPSISISTSTMPSTMLNLSSLWIPFLIVLSKDFTTTATATDDRSKDSVLRLPSQNHQSVVDVPGATTTPSCPALNPKLNYRPVIGILSHPGDGASGRLNNGTHVSYIAASYVKFVESAGARVIPLIYNEPPGILNKKLSLVNGVLFTGGWAKSGLYFDVVEAVFKKVLEYNDAGDHFPVLAICLGLELLTMIISKDRSILEQFSAADQASTLQFMENTSIHGTVFERFPPELLKKLSTDCLVMQNHHYGISPKTFNGNADLCSFFNVLTTSADENNKVYVSSVQAKKYPVTAFQWHPEKNAFEWGLSRIPHSEDAIHVTQHVANYFVSEARKSLNRPPASKVLDNLIYNYIPTYCGKSGRGYDEVYIFSDVSKL